MGECAVCLELWCTEEGGYEQGAFFIVQGRGGGEVKLVLSDAGLRTLRSRLLSHVDVSRRLTL